MSKPNFFPSSVFFFQFTHSHKEVLFDCLNWSLAEYWSLIATLSDAGDPSRPRCRAWSQWNFHSDSIQPDGRRPPGWPAPNICHRPGEPGAFRPLPYRTNYEQVSIARHVPCPLTSNRWRIADYWWIIFLSMQNKHWGSCWWRRQGGLPHCVSQQRPGVGC